MASVHELLAAAQAQKSPLISLLEGAVSGFGHGLEEAPKRALINMEMQKNQLAIEAAKRKEEFQAQARAKLAQATEAKQKQDLQQAGVKPAGVLPSQKLSEEIAQDENGDISYKYKTTEAPAKPAGETPAYETVTIEGVKYIKTVAPNGAMHLQPMPEHQPSSSEFIARGYGDKATEANTALDALFSKGFDGTSLGAGFQAAVLPNAMQSKDVQALENAKKMFGNAIARRESGATIKDDEMARYNATYFPVAGDSPDLLAQKKRNRDLAIANLNTEGGRVKSQLKDRPAPGSPAPAAGGSGWTDDDEKRLQALEAKAAASRGAK